MTKKSFYAMIRLHDEFVKKLEDDINTTPYELIAVEETIKQLHDFAMTKLTQQTLEEYLETFDIY